MNPEDYVSYPIALALKKHGFDEKCLYYYNVNEQIVANERDYQEEVSVKDLYISYNSEYISYNRIDAPTLHQAQKWLREVKKWHIIVEPRIWEQQVYDFKLWHYYRGYENANRGFDYLSYELALSAGIAAALELIEKGGE